VCNKYIIIENTTMSSISHNISYLLSMNIYHTSTVIIYISIMRTYLIHQAGSQYNTVSFISTSIIYLSYMNIVRVEVRMIDIEMMMMGVC